MQVVGGQTASHVCRLLLSVTTVTQAWDLMSLSEVSLYEMWSAWFMQYVSQFCTETYLTLAVEQILHEVLNQRIDLDLIPCSLLKPVVICFSSVRDYFHFSSSQGIVPSAKVHSKPRATFFACHSPPGVESNGLCLLQAVCWPF